MNREMAEIIRNQKPLTLPPNATVQEACRHMHRAQGRRRAGHQRRGRTGRHLHRPRRGTRAAEGKESVRRGCGR